MKDIEIMIVEEFIKDVKNLSDEEQFTIFGSSEMTIREPIENLLKSYKENTSELETYKKIAEKLADAIEYNTFSYKFICDNISDEECKKRRCYQCIIDWARKEVEKDE
jgi:hypothetical protein